jgi:15-cis-phytoene synthase
MEKSQLVIEDAYKYCEELTVKRESNFAIGFQFLPPAKKRAIHVVYAFCRYVDDVSDETWDKDPSGLLAMWREEVRKIYENANASHPIGLALVDVLKSFPIPPDGFYELIAGCEQDQIKKSYETFEELQVYCDFVATSISKVSLPVYGFQPSDMVFSKGRDLSVAFQLTNILRDIVEDLKRGRCYIPLSDLKKFQLSPSDLLNQNHKSRLKELIQFEGERCERYFESGRKVVPHLNEDSRQCVTVMIKTYHTLLKKLLRDPFHALTNPVTLSTEEKILMTQGAACL